MKRFPAPPRRSQRGYMLMLVLVALVAMMISGIALVRSMDTTQLVAGNLSSRNSTLHSADVAVQQAAAWLTANANTGVLNADSPAVGYYAEEQEPSWTATGTWAVCTTSTGATPCSSTDAGGNQVTWLIHRMCTQAGAPSNPGQFCSTANSTAASSTGKSYKTSSHTFTGTPVNFYRVSIQVVGPRNTTTLSQAFITL